MLEEAIRDIYIWALLVISIIIVPMLLYIVTVYGYGYRAEERGVTVTIFSLPVYLMPYEDIEGVEKLFVGEYIASWLKSPGATYPALKRLWGEALLFRLRGRGLSTVLITPPDIERFLRELGRFYRGEIEGG